MASSTTESGDGLLMTLVRGLEESRALLLFESAIVGTDEDGGDGGDDGDETLVVTLSSVSRPYRTKHI